MNIVDLVIIYLTLGAPFAVYKYLQDSRLPFSRRLLMSCVTLVFWIPVAIRFGYRRLTNAYSDDDFVSRKNLDARNEHLAELADQVRARLRTADASLSPLSVREVLDRYVGLAVLSEAAALDVAELKSDLLHAAGRGDDKVAASCLMRRNQQRIDVHHRRARHDFLALFENVVATDLAAAERTMAPALELAHALDDKKALNGLDVIEARIKDEICDPNDQRSVLSNISTSVPRLAMKTAPSNND